MWEGVSQKKEKPSQLLLLEATPFDSDQFCPFVLFLVLMEANTRYCPAPGSFTTLSEVCPFFVRNEIICSNKTVSDLEDPLCHQDFTISK